MEHTPTASRDVSPGTEFDKQYRAVTQGAGICLMGERRVVRIIGDDRASFMNGMSSADTRKLAPGDVVYGLFLTEHAHLIADFYIWSEPQSMTLDIDSELWRRAKPHLEKLLIADDVEFEELENCRIVIVEGPKADQIIRAGLGADLTMPAPGKFVTYRDVSLAGTSRFGQPGFSLMCRTEAEAPEIVTRLVSAGATEIDSTVLEIARVEHGLAKVGADTGDKTLAMEARMERGISFTKGCYLGQETVERTTARGGVKKKLFGLRFSNRVAAGAAVMLAGKEVGTVSSAVNSPRYGAIGLAILHHSAWTPGTEVDIRDSSGSVKATVSELPFS